MNFKHNIIHMLYKTATGSRNLRMALTPVIGISYILFSAGFVILSDVTDHFFNTDMYLQSPLIQALSIPFIYSGLFLMIWSQVHFLISGGTPVPVNPPPVLVNRGPYSWSRNPMLTGIFILLSGLGFARGSISLVCLYTPLFILINVIEIRYIEEPELEKRLGITYLKYKDTTPMFIPFQIKPFLRKKHRSA